MNVMGKESILYFPYVENTSYQGVTARPVPCPTREWKCCTCVTCPLSTTLQWQGISMIRLVRSVGARVLLLTSPSFSLSSVVFVRRLGVDLLKSHVSVTGLTLCTSAQSTAVGGTQFRIATYNILSSHLADPQRFPSCDPDHLDASARLQRVKAKLETEVRVTSIPKMKPMKRQLLDCATLATKWSTPTWDG